VARFLMDAEIKLFDVSIAQQGLPSIAAPLMNRSMFR
jgi:hypothetical protein